jgi:AcrR family transcriptional regulator
VGRPRIHDEALRDRLLGLAAETVSTSGLDSLSVRGLAGAGGTSTAAVYSLFGGKPGVVAAVYRRAFQRFGERLESVGTSDDPVDDIVRLGLAYRRAAVADPHGYRVMFGDRLRPSDAGRRAARTAARTFDPLLDAVRRAVAAGRYPSEPAAASIATALWANVHGLVSLELGAFMPPAAGDPAAVFDVALRAATTGWTLPTPRVDHVR